MKLSNKKTRWREAVIALVILAALVTFNFMTPMLADDYIFSLNRATYVRVLSIGDIFQSLHALRSNIHGNGRAVAHFFAQAFLALPKPVFNIINALAGAFIFFLMYRLVKRGDPKRDAAALFLAFALLWLTMPAWGQVFIWLTGACNYSWTIMFSLLFLTPFIAEYMQRPELNFRCFGSVWFKALYLPVCFAAGAYSENGAFSMLGIAFLLLALIWLRDKKRPQGFLLAAFLVACCGFLFLMLCPAELLGRTGSASGSTFAKNLRLIVERLSGAVGIKGSVLALAALVVLALGIYGCVKSRRFRRIVFVAVPAVVFAAAVIFFLPSGMGREAGFFGSLMIFMSDTKEAVIFIFFLSYMLIYLGAVKAVDKKTIQLSAVLVLGAAASILIFVFAAYFPPRSAAYAAAYTALADMFMLTGLFDKGHERKVKLFTAAAALLLALSLVPAIKDIADSTAMGRERQEFLEQASENGQRSVSLEAIMPDSKFSPFWPGDADYFNEDMCIFYNLDELSISDYALIGSLEQ